MEAARRDTVAEGKIESLSQTITRRLVGEKRQGEEDVMRALSGGAYCERAFNSLSFLETERLGGEKE